MRSETRNEILNIYHMIKADNESDKKLYLQFLIERFEIEISRKLEDLEHEKNELLENQELIKDIKEKLNI